MVPDVVWGLGNFVAHVVCVLAMVGGGAVCISLAAGSGRSVGVSDSDSMP